MHDTHFLSQTVLLFGAAIAVAWLFRVVRAPAVIGFLVAGLTIGPSGLGLITSDAVSQFAELGLILLLFTVGLELSPTPLIRSGRRLFLAAIVQITVTTLIAACAIRTFSGLSTVASLILGVAVALSSTAIVLNQLSERRQMESTGGAIITGVLLLQDVFVILLMLFLPLFGKAASSDWRTSSIRGAFSIAGLIIVIAAAKFILPMALRLVVRWGGRELMTLFAVVMASAGAWLASRAGWSPALGACIAGLLLSQTHLSHQLFAEIIPFRDVFNALFFMSMGMLVDLPAVANHLPMIAVAIAITLIVKSIIAGSAVVTGGWPLRLGLYTGLGLCTVSEFGYVLAREADRLGIFPEGVMALLVAYTVGTMMVGAMIFPIADDVADRISRWWRPRHILPAAESTATSFDQHVIIVGYGLNGQNLAKVLRATKIPYCVIELSHSLAAAAREQGDSVLLGDAARMAILQYAGIATARALVIAINDQQATRRIVVQARAARPDLYILARTRYTTELDVLHSLGAQEVIPEEFETSIEIFSHVLKHLGIPNNVIEAQVTMIRSGRYGMLRGRPAAVRPADLIGLMEATATQTFLMESGSPACGRTIRDIDLRAKCGATIIAVVRGGKPVTNPGADFRFEPSDVLVLVGGHKQLDEAKVLLSPTQGDSLIT
jgi:CPA2 family monovalent cation:H+ antiporter-2